MVGGELIQKRGFFYQIKSVIGNAEDKSIFDTLGEFDLIYCTYGFHHWEKPEAVTDNLMRILSEDGNLICMTSESMVAVLDTHP